MRTHYLSSVGELVTPDGFPAFDQGQSERGANHETHSPSDLGKYRRHPFLTLKGEHQRPFNSGRMANDAPAESAADEISASTTRSNLDLALFCGGIILAAAALTLLILAGAQ